MRKAFVRWSLLLVGGVAMACASTQKVEPKAAAPEPAAAAPAEPAAPAQAAPAPAPAPAPAAKVVTNPAEEDFPVVIGKAPVKIDGDLSDWPALPVGRVANADGSHAVQFRVFVDGARVYAAFEVTDPTPVLNKQGPGNNWQGDAVELFLGTHDESRGGLKAGDVQLIVSYNPESPLAWNYFSQKPMTDAAVVVKDVAGGWVIEASFSLAELGLAAPAPGQPVWLDVALDNSNGGAGRGAQYAWLGTSDLYKTPSMWKKTSFVAQP